MPRVPTSLAESAPLLRELHRDLEVDGRVPFVLTSDGRLAARLVDDLAHLGLKATLLTDPTSLLAAWMETRPPFMLVDIRDPEHFAFCAELKRQPELRDVPLVALAPDPSARTRQALRDAGVDDWLVLPWTASELEARIRGNTLEPWVLVERGAAGRWPLAPVRVLVVDDDPFVQQILEHHFRRRKWDVVLLEDAEEAFERVRAEPFDLIVADALIPPLGVFELMRSLRTLHPAPAPRMVVTAIQDPDATCVRALAWGADDFIAKPFNPAVVAARLGRLVGAP